MLPPHEQRRQYANNRRTRIVALVGKARIRARVKGREFALNDAWIDKAAQQTHCAVSGIEFVIEQRSDWSRDPRGPSIDRIDSKRGYTPDNTRLVCSFVNIAKAEMTDQQFKTMIGHVAEALYDVDLLPHEHPTSSRMDATPVPNPVPRRNGSRSKARPPRVVPSIRKGQYVH